MADSAVSYRSKDGDTVDEIVWRYYGNPSARGLRDSA